MKYKASSHLSIYLSLTFSIQVFIMNIFIHFSHIHNNSINIHLLWCASEDWISHIYDTRVSIWPPMAVRFAIIALLFNTCFHGSDMFRSTSIYFIMCFKYSFLFHKYMVQENIWLRMLTTKNNLNVIVYSCWVNWKFNITCWQQQNKHFFPKYSQKTLHNSLMNKCLFGSLTHVLQFHWSIIRRF